uniref:Uncharacterized protein n=1 Tax=Caenorhabditis tropicalis TaxID=1561998 RepID=A0A1I7TTB3_9PELO
MTQYTKHASLVDDIETEKQKQGIVIGEDLLLIRHLLALVEHFRNWRQQVNFKSNSDFWNEISLSIQNDKVESRVVFHFGESLSPWRHQNSFIPFSFLRLPSEPLTRMNGKLV